MFCLAGPRTTWVATGKKRKNEIQVGRDYKGETSKKLKFKKVKAVIIQWFQVAGIKEKPQKVTTENSRVALK